MHRAVKLYAVPHFLCSKLTPCLVMQVYGESFNISGLGGYVNCGKTGLGAGMAHSPTLPDRDQNGKIKEKCKSPSCAV